jgi:hypothetical protein
MTLNETLPDMHGRPLLKGHFADYYTIAMINYYRQVWLMIAA